MACSTACHCPLGAGRINSQLSDVDQEGLQEHALLGLQGGTSGDWGPRQGSQIALSGWGSSDASGSLLAQHSEVRSHMEDSLFQLPNAEPATFSAALEARQSSQPQLISDEVGFSSKPCRGCHYDLCSQQQAPHS